MQPNQVTGTYQAQQAVEMTGVPAHAPVGPSKYTCTSKTLGILQIIISVVSTVAGTVNIIGYSSALSLIACPIWGALLFYLPAGILGIITVFVSPSSRRCAAIGCLVMSILALCMAGGIIIYAGNSIYHDCIGYCLGFPLIMDSFILMASLTEMILAIAACIYSCLIWAELSRQDNTTVQYTIPAYPTAPMGTAPPQAYADSQATTRAVLVDGGATQAGFAAPEAGYAAPQAGYAAPQAGYAAQNAPNVMMSQPVPMSNTATAVDMPGPK